LKDIPIFRGRADEDVDRYLIVLNRYFKAVYVTEPFLKFDLLYWSLKDKALDFAQALDPPPTCYEMLETRLRRRFGKTLM
jgi:hypothetical protein